MRAAVIGAVCSRSGTVVPADPTNVSEGEIRAAKNYVAGGIEVKTSTLVPCYTTLLYQSNHKN
jgi:hypothetical protein